MNKSKFNIATSFVEEKDIIVMTNLNLAKDNRIRDGLEFSLFKITEELRSPVDENLQ